MGDNIKILRYEYMYNLLMEVLQSPSKLSVSIGFLNENFPIETALIEELYFIEDLFSYCITGKFTFIDAMGLMDTGGLAAECYLFVEYGDGPVNGSDGFVDTVFTFKVIKVASVVPYQTTKMGKQKHKIELLFSTIHFPRFSSQRFSRS
jgi:hypothetical protein